MNYMISRDGQEFGPYTLADLQRYVASGDITPTDMARSEGMTEYLPVSDIIGTIPVPSILPAVSLAPAFEYPPPPNLHWGLVLLFEIVTLGFFGAAWGLVLSLWAGKSNPLSRSAIFYGAYGACLVLTAFFRVVANVGHTPIFLIGLFQLGGGVLSIIARFSLRNTLEDHYNRLEPMGLSLGGGMTFFFAVIYFQYHLNEIARRKKIDQDQAEIRLAGA
ncbi:MAG: DUF4339 domain-containing protein [Bryocella sp.]